MARKIEAMGISWYTPETYERCLEIFDDRDMMPVTYEEWLAKAPQLVREMAVAGQHVVRIEIDPKTFPAWCKANGFAWIDG